MNIYSGFESIGIPQSYLIYLEVTPKPIMPEVSRAHFMVTINWKVRIMRYSTDRRGIA